MGLSPFRGAEAFGINPDDRSGNTLALCAKQHFLFSAEMRSTYSVGKQITTAPRIHIGGAMAARGGTRSKSTSAKVVQLRKVLGKMDDHLSILRQVNPPSASEAEALVRLERIERALGTIQDDLHGVAALVQ